MASLVLRGPLQGSHRMPMSLQSSRVVIHSLCRPQARCFHQKTPLKTTSSFEPRTPFRAGSTPSSPFTALQAEIQTSGASRVLAKLPTISLLRSILIQGVSARPRVLTALLNLMDAHLSLFTKNPLFRFFLNKLFYEHYCAGANQTEVSRTVNGLRALGYKGVILNYAREVDDVKETSLSEAEADALHAKQVGEWRQGTLKTVEYSASGDYVAVKYSGAGGRVVEMLEQTSQPDALMSEALHQICDLAKARGVKLLIDAEHQSQQRAIDEWTMNLMEKYNQGDNLILYNTYQMYLKISPSVLARHMQQAFTQNFNFGVKLVRGAYIKSDPRHMIHDTKTDTDTAFDDAAHMLATQHLQPGGETRPRIGLVLASHNKESVQKMRDLRQMQSSQGVPVADVVYSQLMGMADDLSLSLTANTPIQTETQTPADDSSVYKYVVWGTTEECVKYLLRRAEENRDAVERSSDSRSLMWQELRTRLFSRA